MTAFFALYSSASASFLDTDFWCRTYGCAVVHDGQNYDIYDNWRFDINSCCVPVGGRMIGYYFRAGIPNFTGTLDKVDGWEPNTDEGFMLGFTNGGNTITNSIFDDGDGFLDAGDALAPFRMQNGTDIVLEGTGRQYSHSFFISSRNTRFSLRARATLENATGDFANTVGLGDIRLTPSFTENGNDGGFEFGSRANSSQITIVDGIDDLGDLTGTPTQIMSFGRLNGIRQTNGDIDNQTIRLDFLYTMPEYDLSMGIGSLDVRVDFDFYREP